MQPALRLELPPPFLGVLVFPGHSHYRRLEGPHLEVPDRPASGNEPEENA
jgi:hypothetical protein